MTSLAEKYRPRTLDEFIGQPKAVKVLRLHQQQGGYAGRAYWVTGARGNGKTTLARIIAADVADGFFTGELDAGELTTERLREIEREQYLYGWGDKPGRAYIVNESHGLRAQTVRMLKTILESGSIPAHVVWCFTTTKVEELKLFDGAEDVSPLLARCTQIALTNQGLRSVAPARLKTIAEMEGLDGQDLARYEREWKEHPDFRECINRIADGAMLA